MVLALEGTGILVNVAAPRGWFCPQEWVIRLPSGIVKRVGDATCREPPTSGQPRDVSMTRTRDRFLSEPCVQAEFDCQARQLRTPTTSGLVSDTVEVGPHRGEADD